ncbi:hypothetical protein WALSEDRAFT_32548 [Wallemia mellicola CBS 633.66]|uniref:Protein PBN1 n=1 Tax=Wallemia mellicola (strain ATCC MYA-4683 / CBS 633.66) TaxID=671144 RepID=I4YCF3_WALMC|nr:hypothetical protein WALSEDRAFT_32548 [Wallemia mellicola CBS 633.66]EIM21645.1 hypothetical protein WALSEDRAFT_32548 [Wallemia mellicola CBS 633.66]|eukprot:XP_006958339.1 hypothetical protein WALSEDRAFT_32548 [Wallemia mellicola CBS 633.66]
MHFKVILDGRLEEACSTLILSPSLYVDWDEITRLDNAHKLGSRTPVLLQGNTNVELPEVALDSDDNRTIVQFHTNHQLIEVPVHGRYPLVKKEPTSYLETGVVESTLISSYHSCDTIQSDSQYTNTVYLPTGSSDHEQIVGRVNVTITLLAFAFIIGSVIKQFSRGLHVKTE